MQKLDMNRTRGFSRKLTIIGVVLWASLSAALAHAASDPAKQTAAKKVDPNLLSERYWNAGAPDLNVVQNRQFSKSGRLNLQGGASLVSHDPFMTTYSVVGSLGMHFSEYLGFHAVYMKFFDSNSPAVDALIKAELAAGPTQPLYYPNLNPLNQLFGGEVSWALLYGKLSLIGKLIIHYDIMLLGGAGLLMSQNGNLIAPWAGVAQQIYLSRFLDFRFDFRYLMYSENLIEQNSVITRGQVVANRFTGAPVVTVGFGIYLF